MSDPIVVYGSGVANGRFGFSIVNLGDANNDGYEGVTFDLAVFYCDVIIMNNAVRFLYVQFNLCPLSITPSDIRTSVRRVLFLASLFFPHSLPPYRCGYWSTICWQLTRCQRNSLHLPWFSHRCHQHNSLPGKVDLGCHSYQKGGAVDHVASSLFLLSPSLPFSPFSPFPPSLSSFPQVITASDVMTRIGLNQLKTFGYSLASGVDVDANEYNGMDMLPVVLQSLGADCHGWLVYCVSWISFRNYCLFYCLMFVGLLVVCGATVCLLFVGLLFVCCLWGCCLFVVCGATVCCLWGYCLLCVVIYFM